MIRKKISKLDLDLYKETLDNGLTIYICPMKKNTTHASIVTRFGGDYLDFIPRGKKDLITTPDGTAHFLEHKMFETEDHKDPMVLFSNNGASSNAYTSSNITRYYFEGASHFYDNLEILLDCLNSAYFTKETIEKEQGIITQEINSSLDDPEQRLYYLDKENLFVNHPHKYTVVGTSESIGKLTPEILYDCYNTFYHPSNMFLVITGKVEPQKAIDFVKKYYAKKEFQKPEKIIRKDYKEPNKVKSKKAEIEMDVTNKMVSRAYKIKIDKDIDKFLANMYIMIYIDILFSEISSLYNEVHKDKNILTPINCFVERFDDFMAIHFDAEIIKDESILEKIDKAINKKEFSKEDFDLIIKNVLNSTILATESVEDMSHIIVNQTLLYGDFNPNYYEIYRKLNYEKCLEFIQNTDFSNNSIGIIKGFKKSWFIKAFLL